MNMEFASNEVVKHACVTGIARFTDLLDCLSFIRQPNFNYDYAKQELSLDDYYIVDEFFLLHGDKLKSFAGDSELDAGMVLETITALTPFIASGKQLMYSPCALKSLNVNDFVALNNSCLAAMDNLVKV